MIDLSLAGLLGAVIGTVVAARQLCPLVLRRGARLRARDRSETAEERDDARARSFADAAIVLAADMIVFAASAIGSALIGG